MLPYHHVFTIREQFRAVVAISYLKVHSGERFLRANMHAPPLPFIQNRRRQVYVPVGIAHYRLWESLPEPLFYFSGPLVG